METPYEITTLTRTTQPTPHTAVCHPPLAPQEIPPGVELVTLPNGVRTLAYTQPAPPPAAPQPAPAQAIPRWAKTTALLAPTVGIGVGAAGVGLSYAAPGLIAMSHALWAAVALIATSGLAAAALLRARGRATHISQHVTATGLFGRANGTIHHQ
ncbi:hypothetical protein [Streptomyces sp. ODS28]|uniref:hypothetical protein n=1 Tax=Streptomyces sp. ODS28 TaxID=3136688 RepID=UPI0031EF60D4